MKIREGTRIIDHNGNLLTVTGIGEDTGTGYSQEVRYDDGEHSSIEYAEDHLCPVQPSDRLNLPSLGESTVTDLTQVGDEILVQHVYDDDFDTYNTTLDLARKHLVTPEPEHFETGSIVRFKRTRYRVVDWDGEHHNLVPVDGGEADSLYFSPEFFELVRPPSPKIQSVWEHNSTHDRVLVADTNSDTNTVWITSFTGSRTGISVEQLNSWYTQLA